MQGREKEVLVKTLTVSVKFGGTLRVYEFLFFSFLPIMIPGKQINYLNGSDKLSLIPLIGCERWEIWTLEGIVWYDWRLTQWKETLELEGYYQLLSAERGYGCE